MDDGQQLERPESMVGPLKAAGRRPPAEHFFFGLGLASLLAAAAAVLLAISEGPAGLRSCWREWLVAGLAGVSVMAALLHARQTGLREETTRYPAVYPRVRVALASVLPAAGAVGVAAYRLIRPAGSGEDGLDLFHGAGVPSRPLATAALLATIGCASVVAWSLRRSSRLEQDWLAAGAPRQRAEWQPTHPPRRVAATVLGAAVAVLLVPAGWPVVGALQAQAIERSRSHVAGVERFDPPQHDPAVLTADSSGQSWTRQDLQRAIPAGDLVVGLMAERVDEDRAWNAVLGLRPEDGAQLWQWNIRSQILDVVVDPVDRAVLVLLHATVVVLDFTGEVRTIKTLPTGERRLWRVVEQPSRDVFSDRYPNPHGLARIAVLGDYQGVGPWPAAILGLEIATGTIRWRAEVPPKCAVHAVTVPESRLQQLGRDVLVSFGGGSHCRTHDHVTRFGPDGERWSVSLAPGDPVLRSCLCSGLWLKAISPDLFTVVINRSVDYGDSDEPIELVVLDGAGHQQAALPVDRIVNHSYLAEGLAAGASNPMVAIADRGQWTLLDPAGDPANGVEHLPAPELDSSDPLAVAWPLLVEHRHADTMAVWDASDGLRPVAEITLPAGHGCLPGAGRLYAYDRQASLNCPDGATVVTM